MYLKFPHTLLFALSHASALMYSSTNHTLHLRQLANLQTFNSALGSTSAPPITNSGDPKRPFSVDGQTFDKFESAAQRSCDNQFQGCQREANDKKEFTVGECNEQKEQCKTFQQSASVQDFATAAAAAVEVEVPSTGFNVNIGPDPVFPEFDLICEG